MGADPEPTAGTVSADGDGTPPLSVSTPEGGRRWALCRAIAEATVLEGGGLTLAQARWHVARDLFRSDLPSGDPEDPPAQVG